MDHPGHPARFCGGDCAAGPQDARAHPSGHVLGGAGHRAGPRGHLAGGAERTGNQPRRPPRAALIRAISAWVMPVQYLSGRS
ncbi:MAG: hypothetical protein FP826_11970 [Sphingomonadales bacterium]|nr:hypothetical protein [Sphingomonadales bacterium]